MIRPLCPLPDLFFTSSRGCEPAADLLVGLFKEPPDSIEQINRDADTNSDDDEQEDGEEYRNNGR